MGSSIFVSAYVYMKQIIADVVLMKINVHGVVTLRVCIHFQLFKGL